MYISKAVFQSIYIFLHFLICYHLFISLLLLVNLPHHPLASPPSPAVRVSQPQGEGTLDGHAGAVPFKETHDAPEHSSTTASHGHATASSGSLTSILGSRCTADRDFYFFFFIVFDLYSYLLSLVPLITATSSNGLYMHLLVYLYVLVWLFCL